MSLTNNDTSGKNYKNVIQFAPPVTSSHDLPSFTKCVKGRPSSTVAVCCLLLYLEVLKLFRLVLEYLGAVLETPVAIGVLEASSAVRQLSLVFSCRTAW